MPSHFMIGVKFLRWTGPRLFSHGYVNSFAACWVGHGGVSIGPRPFRHGYYYKAMLIEYEEGEVSIGPRPFRHGYRRATVQNCNACASFNWATSFQTWIHFNICVLVDFNSGFNWATSFQTWIHCKLPFQGEGR